MTCSTSRTLTRRSLVRLFPSRAPRRTAALQLAAMRKLMGFADWLQVRAETAAMELEDLLATRVKQ